MTVKKKYFAPFTFICVLFVMFFVTSEVIYSKGLEDVQSSSEMNVLYKPQEIIRYDKNTGKVVSPKLSPKLFDRAAYGTLFNVSNGSKPKDGFFSMEEEREFKISYNEKFITVKAKVIAIGKYCYIWLLDDSDYHLKTETVHEDGKCTLAGTNAFTDDMAVNVSSKFDSIYVSMTNEETGFAKHAYVNNSDITLGPGGRNGDFGTDENGKNTGDGKVSILLYDIDADGTSEGGHFAGFFSTGDFISPEYYEGSSFLDMFHMDIGIKQGYYALKNAGLNKYFFGTLAHEFQHMLNYMYAGCKVSVDDQDSFTWLNELLSAYANLYYTSPGEVVVNSDTMEYASHNEYSPGKGPGDFLNFNQSFKNYAMANLVAMFFHDLDNNFQSKIYSAFKAIPGEEFMRASSVQIAGKCFEYLFPSANDGDLVESMRKAYEGFMLRFFADGGSLDGKTKLKRFENIFSDGSTLWDKRKENIKEVLTDGSKIELSGYDGVKSELVTHDKIYKVEGNEKNQPYVNINIPYVKDNRAFYYLALNKDGLTSLYTITPGVTKSIDASGANVYLCVAGFLGNISITPSVKWTDKPIYDATSDGDVISVEVDNDNFEVIVSGLGDKPANLRFNLETGNALSKENMSLIKGRNVNLIVYKGSLEFIINGKNISSVGSEAACAINLEVYNNDYSGSLGLAKDDILSEFKFSISNVGISEIIVNPKLSDDKSTAATYLYENGESAKYSHVSASVGEDKRIVNKIKNGKTYLCSSKIIGGILFSDVPEKLSLSTFDAKQKNSYIVKYKGSVAEETVKFSYFDGEKMWFMPENTGSYYMTLNYKYFSDVQNHWAYDYVNQLSSRGIFEGLEKEIFAPNEKVTRAMFVTALARLDGVDLSSFDKVKFNDVQKGSWYFPSVAWASSKNLVLGMDEESFAPNNNITREQAVVILSKYLKYKNLTLKEENKNISFSDEGKISSWALSDVHRFVRFGIVSGRDDNSFDPAENASRAEVSVIFSKLIKSALTI